MDIRTIQQQQAKPSTSSQIVDIDINTEGNQQEVNLHTDENGQSSTNGDSGNIKEKTTLVEEIQGEKPSHEKSRIENI